MGFSGLQKERRVLQRKGGGGGGRCVNMIAKKNPPGGLFANARIPQCRVYFRSPWHIFLVPSTFMNTFMTFRRWILGTFFPLRPFNQPVSFIYECALERVGWEIMECSSSDDRRPRSALRVEGRTVKDSNAFKPGIRRQPTREAAVDIAAAAAYFISQRSI